VAEFAPRRGKSLSDNRFIADWAFSGWPQSRLSTRESQGGDRNHGLIGPLAAVVAPQPMVVGRIAPLRRIGTFTVSEPAQSKRKYTELDETTVTALARKTRAPVEVVKRLYTEELAELQSKSTVKNFISVIAGRRVKERLMTHGSRFSEPHKSLMLPR
jgi:hypothetical protein